MSAIHCSYIDSNGTTAYTYCSVACCDGPIESDDEACCELRPYTGLYLGVSIGTVTVVGLLCLCLACICLKEKIFKKPSFISNALTNGAQTDVEQAEFKGPPAYETLEFPPPYVLFSPETITNTNVPNMPSLTESEIPDVPPPEYSEHDVRGS